MLYHSLSQRPRLSHRKLPLSPQFLSNKGETDSSMPSLLFCWLPNPGARGLAISAGRWRLLRQSQIAQVYAQPQLSLLLQRGGARISLPALLPAARSTVIKRGNDLASCLCLADRVFSFLTHWACKTKWALVFRWVHCLDSNAERVPSTCTRLVWKERCVGPFHPSHWILCSEDSTCMTSSLPYPAHSPFILKSFLRALADIKFHCDTITLPPPLGNKRYQEGVYSRVPKMKAFFRKTKSNHWWEKQMENDAITIAISAQYNTGKLWVSLVTPIAQAFS